MQYLDAISKFKDCSPFLFIVRHPQFFLPKKIQRTKGGKKERRERGEGGKKEERKEGN